MVNVNFLFNFLLHWIRWARLDCFAVNSIFGIKAIELFNHKNCVPSHIQFSPLVAVVVTTVKRSVKFKIFVIMKFIKCQTFLIILQIFRFSSGEWESFTSKSLLKECNFFNYSYLFVPKCRLLSISTYKI